MIHRLVVFVVQLTAAVVCSMPPSVAAQERREVAVTFDDLPLVTYVFRDIATHERITATLLAAIRQHEVPAIGFVNEGKLASDGLVDEQRVALLRRWIAAGLELGNHTYSHRDLHRVPLEEYLRDIARGDSVTSALLRSAGYRTRYFRHPFLHTGRNVETQHNVERFLADRGYRIAPVTIDNSDYVFAAAYERAVGRGDETDRRRIANEYLAYMERIFAYYEQQSAALFGREPRQVLLLHANMLNGDQFGPLANMIERRGYRFVSLEYALADPVYATEDSYTGPSGISWLHRWAFTRGKRGAFFAGEPAVPDTIAKAAVAPIRPAGQ